jgi:hypothetical protein
MTGLIANGAMCREYLGNKMEENINENLDAAAIALENWFISQDIKPPFAAVVMLKLQAKWMVSKAENFKGLWANIEQWVTQLQDITAVTALKAQLPGLEEIE